MIITSIKNKNTRYVETIKYFYLIDVFSNQLWVVWGRNPRTIFQRKIFLGPGPVGFKIFQNVLAPVRYNPWSEVFWGVLLPGESETMNGYRFLTNPGKLIQIISPEFKFLGWWPFFGKLIHCFSNVFCVTKPDFWQLAWMSFPENRHTLKSRQYLPYP